MAPDKSFNDKLAEYRRLYPLIYSLLPLAASVKVIASIVKVLNFKLN